MSYTLSTTPSIDKMNKGTYGCILSRLGEDEYRLPMAMGQAAFLEAPPGRLDQQLPSIHNREYEREGKFSKVLDIR